MKDSPKKAKFLEIDCDEIPVPFAVLQGYWVVQNLHLVMIFARVVQIAIVATGFLHVVLPLTSCDFCSQILSVYESSIKVFLFFFFFSCISANFNMFQITYKYISVSSEDFGSLKFPWRKVQHSESGWYAHDLRYMFVITSSSPPWRLTNFF